MKNKLGINKILALNLLVLRSNAYMEGLTFKIIEDSQREEFIFICIMSPEAPLLDS